MRTPAAEQRAAAGRASDRSVAQPKHGSEMAGRPLTDEEAAAELRRLGEIRDEDIDLSDIPEIVDWSHATRGKFYRPVKTQLTMRLDADLVAWFRDHHPHYQTAINEVLRDHVSRAQLRERREDARTKSDPTDGSQHRPGRYETP